MNIASCNLCARAKVKGHTELKIEENFEFLRKIGRVFFSKFGSCRLGLIVLHLWAMAGTNGTVFDTSWPPS